MKSGAPQRYSSLAALHFARTRAAFAGVFLASAAFAGCSAAESSNDDSTSAIAFERSFAGFRTWEAFHYDLATASNADVHTSGPRTEFLNHRPPAGSTTFPVGTIIVKEIEGTDEATHKIFAMTKRGGKYNAGAPGWEWFELEEVNGAATIKWRGVGPPDGENYGGDPKGGCNTCHGEATNNDSVKSDALQLSKL